MLILPESETTEQETTQSQSKEKPSLRGIFKLDIIAPQSTQSESEKKKSPIKLGAISIVEEEEHESSHISPPSAKNKKEERIYSPGKGNLLGILKGQGKRTDGYLKPIVSPKILKEEKGSTTYQFPEHSTPIIDCSNSSNKLIDDKLDPGLKKINFNELLGKYIEQKYHPAFIPHLWERWDEKGSNAEDSEVQRATEQDHVIEIPEQLPQLNQSHHEVPDVLTESKRQEFVDFQLYPISNRLGHDGNSDEEN